MRKIIVLSVLAYGSLWAGAAQAADTCAIQRALAKQGFYEGQIDCSEGPQTESAIRAFQRSKGLYVDGVVGEDTHKKLLGRFSYEKAERNDDGADEPREIVREESNDEPEGKGQCRDTVKATGYRRMGEGRAKESAKRAWSNKVATLDGYGLAYTDLGLARQQNIECIRACAECSVSKVCTIVADPCRTD